MADGEDTVVAEEVTEAKREEGEVKSDVHEDSSHDEDICESCRWRELHLAAVTSRQEKLVDQQKEENAAIEQYLEGRRQDDDLKEQEEKSNRRKLANDIHEYNKGLAQSKIAEPKVEKEDPGAYLLYRRPQTAEKDRQKQKDLFDDLSRQVEQKRQKDAADRDTLQSANNSHFLQSQKDLDLEESRERGRLDRKRLEYRQGLEAQMAANRVENDTKVPELWWTKQAPVQANESAIKPTVPQLDRVAKQQAAYRNLQEFVKKQNETDEEAKQKEKDRRQGLQAKYNAPQIDATQLSTAGEARATRLKLAEDAWRKAFDETEQKKVRSSREHQGGALMDQLSQYRRCKKCHKSIQQSPTKDGGAGKYWYNGDTDQLHRLDGVDYRALNLRDSYSIQPKSRHFVF